MNHITEASFGFCKLLEEANLLEQHPGDTIRAELVTGGELVGQRDRISVDVSDIRDQIEACRDDFAWAELPLAAKIRVLLRERLEQIEAEKGSEETSADS
jgi:hypothetical protein